MSKDTSDGDSVIGKVEEKLGWLTGDREAEAKGKLKRLGADATDDDATDDHDATDDESHDTAAAEAVDEAERDNRANYGEYDPSVDGAETATEARPVDRPDQ